MAQLAQSVVISLIGFRNRLSVLSQWVWNYVTYTRTARLIIGRNRDLKLSQPDGESAATHRQAAANEPSRQEAAQAGGDLRRF